MDSAKLILFRERAILRNASFKLFGFRYVDSTNISRASFSTFAALNVDYFLNGVDALPTNIKTNY